MLNLFSYPNYEDLRDRADVFDALVVHRFTPIAASANGVNERLWAHLVSGNYFGARRAACDRAAISLEDDAQRGASPVP